MTGKLPSWYHGPMSADEATAVCFKVGQNGAFLVRESQRAKGAFTLSVFVDKEVYHHRILPSTGNRVVLESSQEEFDSLEKLVDQYKNSGQKFIHPLTIAIYPSLVKQLHETNEKLEISPVSPVYVVRDEVNKPLPAIPIPKPKQEVPPKLPPNVSPKPPKVASKPTRKPPDIPKVPQTGYTSLPASSSPEKENVAASPSLKTSKGFTPQVKSKPTVNRSRSDSSEFQRCDNSPKQSSFTDESFTTFGKDKNHQRSSGKERNRPVSCFLRETDIQLVYDEPEREADVKHGNDHKLTRRRTVSANDMHWVTLKRDHEDNKEDEKKKSKLKNFKDFFRKGKGHANTKRFATKKIEQNGEEEDKQVEQNNASSDPDPGEISEDVFEGNNNQTIPEDYTPILCKTQFVTTIDYSTSENALSFTKDTEMAVRGVRMDGWWFCENKVTQETGWVYMHNLKPKNKEWFEAKPVQTTQDYEIYQQLDFGSREWDTESDDDTYCKYNFPVPDTNIVA